MVGALGSLAGGIVAVLGLFGGALWKWNRSIMDHLAQQDVEIATIKHEVFENSGKSMRDRINQTAEAVAELNGYLKGKGDQ